jgi:hypothetical protein
MIPHSKGGGNEIEAYIYRLLWYAAFANHTLYCGDQIE